jgi:hypothetical protein
MANNAEMPVCAPVGPTGAQGSAMKIERVNETAEPGSSRGRVAPPSAPSRQFDDSTGRTWTVFERQRRDPGGGWSTVLIFDCSQTFRCVRVYPTDWATLSAASLERVSWDS